jgi:ABC-type polysaccharide/polyol phosphate transport system ATPase subunit
MSERILEIDGVSKQYRLGAYGSGTLQRDLQSWFARIRGKEDPNRKINARNQVRGEYFMALDEVSMAVDRGDAVGILGRNGAGKSTLLKLISRITAPTGGEIRIKGRVASLLEIGTGFHPELTGRENIYLNGAIMGLRKAEISRKMDEIVEFSEISQFVDTPVKRYSSGMYVKLAFAVAAHLDPDVLICDEVLAVGDVAFQQKCLSKMVDVARSGRAVIYVSHNMRTVSQLCNRAVFLEHGRLIYDGTVSRAMDMYSGAGVRSVERDLTEIPRNKNRGVTMRMKKLRVLDSETMEYEQDSKMRFDITTWSRDADDDCRMRVILTSHSAAPVAMAQCAPFSVGADSEFSKRFTVNLRGVAPGEYGIKLQLVSTKSGGRSVNHDTIEDAGHFVITDDPGLNHGFVWNEPVWGNVRLDDMEVEDI